MNIQPVLNQIASSIEQSCGVSFDKEYWSKESPNNVDVHSAFCSGKEGWYFKFSNMYGPTPEQEAAIMAMFPMEVDGSSYIASSIEGYEVEFDNDRIWPAIIIILPA